MNSLGSERICRITSTTFNRGACPATPKRLARRSAGLQKSQGQCSNGRSKRSGLITTTYATAGAFLRSSPDVLVPDLQLVFVIALVDDHARKLHLGHGISCHVEVLRPYSRGTVRLNSNDPRDTPVIDPQFLSDERDMKLLLKGAQIQQRIMESKPFDSMRGKMLYPTRIDDPAGMERDIRNRADTQYHPVGTCKMGPESDPMAVVDARLRVQGHRLPASSGCLDHADGGRGQYQCAGDHDRGTGRRHDSRGCLKPRESPGNRWLALSVMASISIDRQGVS